MIKVMTFGAFDGLHSGHKAFLAEAKKLGDYLIVAVAQDHIIEHLEGKLPQVNLAERFKELEKNDHVDEVVKQYKPDIIAIGYDQDLLREDLEKHILDFGYMPQLKQLTVFENNEPNR